MHELYIKPQIQKKLLKIAKKNPKQYEIILKKVEEILQDPDRYKNLKSPYNALKRVHIDTQFVLLFSVSADMVILEDYDHHDNIYV